MQPPHAKPRGGNDGARPLPTPKRKPIQGNVAALPHGKALERLAALCALAKAHARAKAAGALAPPSARKPRAPKRMTQARIRDNLEARIEMMIELETRWRMEQLGVPYTDKIAQRFERFRFDSDHRRDLEARHLKRWPT